MPPNQSTDSVSRARPCFARSGGIAGMTGSSGRSAGFKRNATGYFSGSVFSVGSVGSVERQAYRRAVHAKPVHTSANGDVLRTSSVVARQRRSAGREGELVVMPSSP